MATIKLYGELESKSTSGILLRYSAIGDVPIIQTNLSTLAERKTNTYYQHTGTTTDTYTNGIIYFCNDSKEFLALDGKKSSGTGTDINFSAVTTDEITNLFK